MKLRGNYFYTQKEDVKDEDSISGKLLVRSGMIKKTSSGIYMYLPLGLKVLKNIENITIGDNVSIHDMCYIDGYGGIKIGNNVSIAHNTSILTSTHTWSDQSIPIKYNQVIAGKVVIEDDVWIGCAVRILYKVTIGQRSVIAAGTVVTTNLQSGWLGAGIPMKHKKKLEDW